jgi:sec-independent protein translocase protein TatA
MGVPAPTELLLILAIIVLVFGGKKIPEIMGGIGQGIREFKKSLEGDEPTKGHGPEQPTPQLPLQEAKPDESAGGKTDPR